MSKGPAKRLGTDFPRDFRPVRKPELAYVRAGEDVPVVLMVQTSTGERLALEWDERKALQIAEDIIRLVNARLWQQGRGK